MKRPYLIDRLIVKIKRMPYRKGYGIHSPFAYQFVTKVIYGKLPKEQRKSLSKLPARQRRIEALLLRAATEQQVSRVFIEKEISPAIRQLLNQVKSVQSIEQWQPSIENAIVYSDVKQFLTLHANELTDIYSQTKVFLTDIRTNFENRLLWDECKRMEAVRVSFDLYDLGILVFDTKLQKQDYLISF